MAVTIVHNLLPVHFSRNAVEVRFSTTDKYTTTGAKNRSLLIFSTYPTSGGETLEVEYTKDGETYQQTFTFEDSPDVNSFEIETYSGSGLTSWLQEVIAGLQGDPNLAADWIIGYWDDDPIYGVMLQAQFEDDTNIAFTATGFNITVSHPTDGAIGEARENYRLSAWLYLGQTATSQATSFDRTPEIELDADENSLVELNLRRYLDDMLYDYEEPPTSLQPAVCSVINRPAYLLFGQKWGDPVERRKQFKSPIFRVLKGGLNPRDFADKKDDLPAWLGERFLTNRYHRLINGSQADYLYWYCDQSLTNVVVQCRATLENGTVETIELSDEIDVEEGQVYKFRITRDECIGDITGWQVVEFNIRLIRIINDVPILMMKESVYYRPDDNYLDQVFEFENSQGVIESWKFTGERSIGHEISKALYKTELPFNAGVSDRSLHSYNERDTMEMKVSTGPLSLSESRAFPDFLRSRYVWLVEGDNRIPVRIPGGKHLAESWNLTGNHKRGSEFVVELGQEQNVSREIL